MSVNVSSYTNRLTLEQKTFADGAKPTGKDFSSLIGTTLLQGEDGIAKTSASAALAIEAATDDGEASILEFYEDFGDDESWGFKLKPRLDGGSTDDTATGFGIVDGGSGMARFFIEKGTGNVGISTVQSPLPARLTLKLEDTTTPALQILNSTGASTIVQISADGRAAFGAALPTSDATRKFYITAQAGNNALVQVENKSAGYSAEYRATTTKGDHSWAVSGSHDCFGIWDYNKSLYRFLVWGDEGSGNVSIGGSSTSKPAARLVVQATDATSDLLRLTDSSGTSQVAVDKAGVITAGGLSVNGPITLSQAYNGGGIIAIKSNSNENSIYVEAWDGTDANGSADEMIFSGCNGGDVPTISFRASNTIVRGTLAVGQSTAAASGAACQVKGVLTVGDGSGPDTTLTNSNYIQVVASLNNPVRVLVENKNTGSNASAELRAKSQQSDFGWCADAGSPKFRVWDFTHDKNLLYIAGSSGDTTMIGKLSVGTSNAPSATLDVAGTISATGALNAANVVHSTTTATTTINDKTIQLSLQTNGGGILKICNNPSPTPGDGMIYLEACNNTLTGAANGLIIGGFNTGGTNPTGSALVPVTICGDLYVTGNLKFGGNSNVANLQSILVANVSHTGCNTNNGYALDLNTSGFSSFSRSGPGSFTVNLANPIPAGKAVCMATLCQNASTDMTGQVQDNTISAAFVVSGNNYTAVKVTVFSNNPTTSTDSFDKSGTGTGDENAVISVGVGGLEDSPFSLMVIRLA